MQLANEEGSLIFIKGPFGSGKTLLAIEIAARVIAAKREQQGKEDVSVSFVSNKANGEVLMEAINEKKKGVVVMDLAELIKNYCGRNSFNI